MKPIYSKAKIMSAALALSALGLGVSMPSCPGNQAVQSQVDALQTSQADLNRKILALDSQMRIVDTDMPQIKQILAQMTSTMPPSASIRRKRRTPRARLPAGVVFGIGGRWTSI